MRQLKNLTLDRIAIIALSLITFALVFVGARHAYPRMETRSISISSGSPKGETYILMQAVKAVAERYYPRLKISVVESSGTVDSLNRIENGEAQFATVEASVIAGAAARSVAVLFPDTMQLLVHDDSKIQRFQDLKGKRVALTRTQGPFRTFMLLARHFGLRESDFSFIGSDDESAEVAFTRNEADAFFAVRVLRGGATLRLVKAGGVRILPIDDALALHMEVPAFQAAAIPKASYLADPPIPPVDTATLSSDRLLLARADVPDYVVFEITEILMERRQEIAAAIPDTNQLASVLPANIRAPDGRNGLSAGVHSGAALYYNHGQIKDGKVEIFTSIVTVCVLIGLWMWAIHSSIRRRQKIYADAFNRRVLQLMDVVLSSTSDRQLESVRTELLALMERVVLDLESDKFSEESFQTSRVVWQIAFDLLRERYSYALSGGLEASALKASAGSAESRRPRRWSLLRDS